MPLAALLASNGNYVKAFDKSLSVRNSVRNRDLNSSEPRLSELICQETMNLEVMDTLCEAINDSEVIFIIVPTPSTPSGHFSNENIIEVVRSVGNCINYSDKIVIDIVSTVMPGSCEGPIKEALESSSQRVVGVDLGLCYNPEFIALGSVINDMEMPDMHLIGQSSSWAGDYVERALQTIVKKEVPSRRMSLTEAELVKIAVNNFVTMKISFANALMQAASQINGVDIDVVTDALGLDSRIGNKYLKAAAPYGGPCFPRDTRALNVFFQDLGVTQSLSKATEEINRSHTKFIIDSISSKLEVGMTVGIIGLSYKAGTSVIDDSPGISIAQGLSKIGFKVLAWDEEINLERITMNEDYFQLIRKSADLLSQSDFVVVTRVLSRGSDLRSELLKYAKPVYDLWRQF